MLLRSLKNLPRVSRARPTAAAVRPRRSFVSSLPLSAPTQGQFVPKRPTERTQSQCEVEFIPRGKDLETLRTEADKEREAAAGLLSAQQIASQAESKRASLLDCMEWYDAMEYDALRPTTLLDRDGKTICAPPLKEEEENFEYAFISPHVVPSDA